MTQFGRPTSIHLHLYAEARDATRSWEDAVNALRPRMVRASSTHHTIELAETMVYVRSTGKPERLLGMSVDSYSTVNDAIPDALRGMLVGSRHVGLDELLKEKTS